ncbi:hypothetical protein UK23_02190 [Lentzea aerocolonigenes]|uniref:Lipoprotein n=1 Tax=Lentzea aerocolonigenes TaxID=68170 RepID=A0A0F0HGH0_LENAE|nr:hypothetical protein [Lentzea aerocolonigenes]KJK52798.1 hypothetical protein UK23_02190 [Lentzea aerocolonigenes]
MTRLRAVVALYALVLLAGCQRGPTETEKLDSTNNELGKKIVADWQAVSGVAAAKYDYHRTVSTMGLGFDAALKPESASDTLVQELVEIAKRDYWQSTADIPLAAAIFRSGELPETPVKDKSIIMFDGPIKIDMYDKAQVAEMNAKYGPKPEKK